MNDSIHYSKEQRTVDNNELIEKLRQEGFAEFVDTFLLNTNDIHIKKGKGRLNKSKASRLLGTNVRSLDMKLQAMRRCLGDDCS